MSLVFLFRRLVFAQVLCGIIAFCMAEPGGNPGLLLVAGTLAALSWYVVEGPSGRPLPQWVIHMGAFAAVGLLVLDLRWQRDVVLAMGHFTMWLQVIQLYGRKTNREYGLLLVLSLLQVVGASMISQSMIFGLMLVAYCVLALFTVLLFRLKVTSDWVGERNVAAAPHDRRAPRPKAIVGRGHRWQFRVTTLLVGLVCAAVASVLFVILPRSGGATSPIGGRIMDHTQVGYGDEIDLDRAPPRGDRRTAVLNMSVNLAGREVGSDDESWLLRGKALDYYDHNQHAWKRSASTESLDRSIPVTAEGVSFLPAPGPGEYEFEMTMRDQSLRTLFAVYPFSQVSSPNVDSLSFNPLDQHLSARSQSGAMMYRMRRPSAAWNKALADSYLKQVESPSQRVLERYARGWDGPTQQALQEQAFKVLRAAGLSRDPAAASDPNDAQIARALTDYLRLNYKYSLDNPAPSREKDPIVDFLNNRKKGHCELFASALAAMARSIGMRARVVVGFRAGEYNHVGGYYVVRQSDAHAWTEIDVGAEGWQAFDATPPDEVAAEHMVDRGLLTPLRELYEHLEFTWLSSIVSFDKGKRREILASLSQKMQSAANDRDNWFGAMVNWFKDLPRKWELDRLGFILVTVAVVFIIVGLGSLLHTLIRRRKRLTMLQLTRLPRRQRRALARRLGFYLRMLELLERQGLVRPLWQSPAQFAHDLAQRDAAAFSPVVALTEQFYEIRFGHRELDSTRRSSIRDQLKSLEQLLSTRARSAA